MDGVDVKARGSGLMVWLAVAAVIFALLHRVLSKPRDAREPPYIDAKIPLLGHIIGLYLEGARYFTRLNQEHKHNIYTLAIPLKPMYVVGSADWSNAVQKHSSSIDLYSLSARALKTLSGLNHESMEIVQRNLHGDKRQTSDNIIYALKEVMVKTLVPGKDLDELNTNFLKCLESLFNGLARGKKPEKMMFWSWTRQQISEATMAASYGPDNPAAKEPSIIQDFWTFDANAAGLMMPFPQIFARTGHLALWRFINGFVDYAARGGYKTASTLIQVRAKETLAHGLALDQYGHMESSFAPGLLSNTVPAIFWLISRIFEDARLLKEIRAEIDQCIEVGEGNKRMININKVQTQCPLFASAFLEILRTVSPLNNYRYIREDTLVTNSVTQESYLLKKDNLVQLASTILHSRAETWGEDPESFNARRFTPVVNRARAGHNNLEGSSKPMDPSAPFRDGSGKMHSGSFRPFGGGVHLCPGRFFAQTGILAAAALWITSFEMESEGDEGYTAPPFESPRGFMFLSIIKPEKDVEVKLRRREGFEDAVWEFDMTK